jgi:peptide chain release factor 3
VVFKIQANLDPRHRDRVAFVRVCAGRFARDMEVILARTGEKIRIKRAHRLFANERDTTDEAFAGDIIGMVNPGHFHLGDTLYAGSPVQYEGQWEFAPECFARLRCTDTAKRKQFSKGVSQLVEEGVVRILTDQYSNPQEPVLAAVGELQFDVVKFRLESDYATPTRLEKMPYSIGRWIDATADELARLTLPSTLKLMYDNRGAPVLLFPDEWEFNLFRQKNPDVVLQEVRGTRHE